MHDFGDLLPHATDSAELVMCLGEIRQVAAVRGDETVSVWLGDRVLDVCTLALDVPVHEGDWVLVHSGFAVGRLTEEQAHAALAMRRGISA